MTALPWASAVEATLTQAALASLTLGAAAALVVGLGLLLAPARAVAITIRFDRYYDIDEKLAPLQKVWYWERFFYRHHRALGSLMLVGSLYIIVVLMTLGDSRHIAAALGVTLHEYVLVLIESCRAMLMFGSVFAFAFGCIVLIRPSLLKPLEQEANRWVNPPKRKLPPRPRPAVAHPRRIGLFLTVGGVYTLASLALALLVR
ncbi:MAG TPA: hypothetical protein VFK24_00885 [Gammaproteobacteria bacterium]|nr:hypothetical protein [Gammaproteobacteria bacterium]